MSADQEFEEALKQFSPTDAAIQNMRDRYGHLTIGGVDDRVGYVQVHEARMKVKAKRVEVEKTRKALKADALRYGRVVDGEAKRITALLRQVEDPLAAQLDKVKEIKEEAKRKALAERDAKIARRAMRLAVYGAEFSVEGMLDLSEDEFGLLVTNARKAHEKAEAERVAAEKAEAEKLEVERARLEAQRAEQEAVAERLRADARLLEAAREEKHRKEEAAADAWDRSQLSPAGHAYASQVNEFASMVRELPAPDGALCHDIREILNTAAGQIEALVEGDEWS